MHSIEFCASEGNCTADFPELLANEGKIKSSVQI